MIVRSGVSFLRWLAWLWRTRNCAHPRTVPTSGEERVAYGYRRRCLDCDKPLR